MDVRLAFEGERAVLSALATSERYARAGLRRAANRAASRLRTRAVKGITGEWHLKASYVRGRLHVGQAAGGHANAYVRARRRATLTARFPHRQVYRTRKGRRIKAGVSVRIRRGRGPQRIYSGFLVPLKRGNQSAGSLGQAIAVRTSVLRRLGKRIDAGSVGGSGARQYQVLHTTSVLEMFREQVERGEVLTDVQRYFLEQVDKEMQRAIARATA
ncbi:hypothetical protein [Abyssibacter profundi]|uniref:Uncharacterized protein n=1 Tax=Abyssibacter profundi TaxID=2182787 RepID=A0A363ULB2_9GAMM|nr:hypothetical protein [Abyssibacter profundi]PWN56216.1 hypothetical protein DEH80_08055 [Abyssibacter profundi]